MTRIWVDLMTGTFGNPADMVVIEVDDATLALISDGITDGQRMDWARELYNIQQKIAEGES